GVTEGPDQSGIWGYLNRSPGATAWSDWGAGDLSIGIPFSNTMYDITPYSVGGGKWRTSMSQNEFDALPAAERMSRQSAAITSYLASPKGAFQTIHELIHNSVKPFGAGDEDLAIAISKISDEGVPEKGK